MRAGIALCFDGFELGIVGGGCRMIVGPRIVGWSVMAFDCVGGMMGCKF